MHRGTLPAGSRRFSASFHLRIGVASHEVLRPYDVWASGAPSPCDRREASHTRRGEPPPRRCRPRVFSTPRRFQPRHRVMNLGDQPKPTRTATSLRPEAVRPYFMPQTSMGLTLQSFPLSKSRAAFRRPFTSVRVQPGPPIPARESRGFPAGFDRPADPEPNFQTPCGIWTRPRTGRTTPHDCHVRPPALRPGCPERLP